MKCILSVCFLVFSLSTYCEGGALRCPPGVLDPACIEEKKEDDTQESTNSGSALVETQCLVGTEWESNCHYCRCSDSGIAECLKQDVCEEGIFAEPAVCKPNTTFQRDCNTCICLDNGLGLCTLEFCRRSHNFIELTDLTEKEDSEKESTNNSDKSDVVPITKSSKNATKAQVCVANRMFVKDCNTCWCNEDGTSYFCTRRVCVPLLPDEEPDLGGIPAENMTLSRKTRSFPTSETQKTCQPGQEFRLDCNQCLCDNTGLSFSCTRNDCSSLNNHHASKRDVPNVEPIDIKCVAGSVFDRECNVCRCTEDGSHATCTIKRCTQKNELDSDINVNDPGFRCNAGEQFKRVCNDCTCSADGKSIFCTLRLCDVDLAEDIETQSN